jgi:hypothetical protein
VGFNKGPVDSFKGFQQRTRRAISAQKKIDPETGRSVDPAEVGGLHQVVSEMIFLSVDFRRRRQQVKEETE